MEVEQTEIVVDLRQLRYKKYMWALPKLGTSQVRTVLVARLNIHFPSLSGYVHQAFIYATDRNVMSCVIYINLLETRDVSC